MANRLDGKVALVTGAGQGIGRGIAVRLARDGARVLIEDLASNDQAARTLNLIRGAGGEARALTGDMGRVQDVNRVLAQAENIYGRLDILVNNAGIEREAPFLEVTEQDYEEVLNVNLKGPFFACQAFARQLKRARRPGRIINISSVHQELPFPRFSSYCVSKGGLEMLTRTLAVELGELGITVNNIAPGAIRTPINQVFEDPSVASQIKAMIPLRRLGMPVDVASVASFLASDDARYITGTTIYVDGGLLWNYDEPRGEQDPS